MANKIRRFHQNEEGPDMVEYTVLVAIIALSAI
jgi:Flp pilus assembly pilin Flp